MEIFFSSLSVHELARVDAGSAQNQEAGNLRIMMLVTGLILLAPMTYIIAPARSTLVQF